MYLLTINLYEFGQFLRIFLWIFLPMVMIAMLATTYFHYRRKRGQQEGMVFSVNGYALSRDEAGLAGLPGERAETSDPAVRWNEAHGAEKGEAPGSGKGEVNEKGEVPGAVTGMADENGENFEEGNGNIYKGILWMKEKYEQYRDLADKRYEDLKEELTRAEKKYQDLLADMEADKVRALGEVGKGATKEMASTGELAAPGEDAVATVSIETAGETALWTGTEVEQASIRDIVEEKNRQIHFLQGQLDQRIKSYHQLEYLGRDNKNRLEELEKQYAAAQQTLEERQRTIDERQHTIDEMDGWLVIERNKVEELVAKLQHNSLLLMNIYKELDKSLNLGLGNPV